MSNKNSHKKSAQKPGKQKASCDLSVGCSLGVSPGELEAPTIQASEAPNEHS